MRGIYYSSVLPTVPLDKALASPEQLEQFASLVKETDDSVIINLPNGEKRVLSRDFIEWLRGFIEAEGCFRIKPTSVNGFQFLFSIVLHDDDIKVLKYIQSMLGIGDVSNIGSKSSQVYFEVNIQSEILMIIAIFAKYNLNSTKYLNYLAFVQAYILYTKDNSRTYRKEIKPFISDIVLAMNSQRTDFTMPANHNLVITAQ